MAQGSTGNVIAALASFFIPGLGQLMQGRVIAGIFYFLLTAGLWIVLLGWLGHIVACLDAAVWKGRISTSL
jgi:TM2 domain-containing membrane protein YozV